MQHELINVETGIHDTTTRLQGKNEAWSASMRRLAGGLSDGVDVVTLNNGRLSLDILPTRGMGIWRGMIDGIPVKWDSPVERPVHPTFVEQMRRGGIGWLDGFNELICRCGLGWHGAPGHDVIRDAAGNVVSEQFLPLHGRIANLAAHRVTVEERGDLVAVHGIVDEASLFGGNCGWNLRLRRKSAPTVLKSPTSCITSEVSLRKWRSCITAILAVRSSVKGQRYTWPRQKLHHATTGQQRASVCGTCSKGRLRGM